MLYSQPKFVQENETEQILWNFETKMDHPILVVKPA